MYWSLLALTRNRPASAGKASSKVATAYTNVAHAPAKRGAGTSSAAGPTVGREQLAVLLGGDAVAIGISMLGFGESSGWGGLAIGQDHTRPGEFVDWYALSQKPWLASAPLWFTLF